MHAAPETFADKPCKSGTPGVIHNSSTVFHKKPRRIICAALRHRKYPTRIIASVRHGDAVMLAQLHPMENPNDFDAGFLDSGCQFLTRAEAAVVAVAAGQVPEGTICCLRRSFWANY